MKVEEENLSYSSFKKKYPKKHLEYLRQKKLYKRKHGMNVLVSRKFYYFGDKAINLPKKLKHIIINGRSCKCVTDEDIRKLRKYIEKCGYRKYGVFGKPNNRKNSSCDNKC